jgi:branched-chain amino acid transport system substrate-binding protein
MRIYSRTGQKPVLKLCSRRPSARGLLLGATTATVAVGLAACGSSSDSGSGSGSSSAASKASGKATYVLGALVSESGPISSSVGPIGPTVDAWGKWTNAHGGIDGHQVKVIVVDDGGDSSRALAAVKKMVQEDHIIALVPGSGNETIIAPYLLSAKIPVIGGTLASPLYSTDRNWFATGTSPSADSYAALKAGKDIAGSDKLAVMYCSEVAACSGVVDQIKQVGGSVGTKVVSSSAISSSATDYTAPCLAAKGAKANGLFISAAAQQHVNVGRSCARQGFTAPQVTSDLGFSNLWLKVPSLNGSVSSTPAFPFIDSSTQATKDFQAAIDQYLPDAKAASTWGPVYASAWTSAAIFGAAAKAAAMGDSPSAAGVFKGLYALKDETLGGLSTPINYVQGDNPNVKNKCAFVVQITDGKFTEPQGLKPICMP